MGDDDTKLPVSSQPQSVQLPGLEVVPSNYAKSDSKVKVLGIGNISGNISDIERPD